MFASALRSQATRLLLPTTVLLSAPVVVAWCWDASSPDGEKHRVVIVGGGTAGIGIAAQLRNKGMHDVVIVEPSATHYYQPLWTLVGGGLRHNTQSVKPMAKVIPRGVKWIQDAVDLFEPNDNVVRTKDGKWLEYDYLVVATGMQQHFDQVPGLQETIGKNGAVSIYDYHYAERTREALQNLKSGTMIFTQHADSPIKCGGAPQKIMYLAEDNLRYNGLRDQVKVQWVAPQPTMFAVPKYNAILTNHCDDKGIERHHQLKLVKVNGPGHVASFQDTTSGKLVDFKFDILHVIPFMKPPEALRQSKLVDATGFVNVDAKTLQHTIYANVFAAGDCSNLPTSKTMAAIAKQAPIVVHNLLALDQGKKLTAEYDGYTSCPLVMGRKKLLLAEFKYGGALAETFEGWQDKPRRAYMLMKEILFPYVYWTAYLHGKWYGPKMFRRPKFPEE